MTTILEKSYPHHHRNYIPSPLSSSSIHQNNTSPVNYAQRQSLSSPIMSTNTFVEFTPSPSPHTVHQHQNGKTSHSPIRKRRDAAASSFSSPSMANSALGLTSSSGGRIPFSRRPIKVNPLIHVGKDRETRRKLFLKRVREEGEERRWRDRGGDDELLRGIWVAEEKRRVERKEREFLLPPSSFEDDEEVGVDGMVFMSSGRSVDEEMANEIAEREDEEMEAMFSMMENTNTNTNTPTRTHTYTNSFPNTANSNSNPHTSPNFNPSSSANTDTDRGMDMQTPYGSDDEEYDHLFLSAIQEIENRNSGALTGQSQVHLNSYDQFQREPELDHGDDRMDES